MFAMSNDSGWLGRSAGPGTQGETVEDICARFPYWFCPNYQAYRGHEAAMPFDQHFLLKAIEPRYVYVASAAQDAWADPAAGVPRLRGGGRHDPSGPDAGVRRRFPGGKAGLSHA